MHIFAGHWRYERIRCVILSRNRAIQSDMYLLTCNTKLCLWFIVFAELYRAVKYQVPSKTASSGGLLTRLFPTFLLSVPLLVAILSYPRQGYNSATGHSVWLVRSPGAVYHCTFVRHLHYQRSKTCSRHLFSRSYFTD